MHFLKTSIAVALTMVAAAQAQCVAVHTYLNTEPAGPDTMSIQLWEAGQELCRTPGDQHHWTSNSNSVWTATCRSKRNSAAKWKVRVTNNGKKIELEHDNGHFSSKYGVTLKNHEHSTTCKLYSQSGTCQLWGGSFESCAWTTSLCSSNRGETCNLCDGRAFCSGPP